MRTLLLFALLVACSDPAADGNFPGKLQAKYHAVVTQRLADVSPRHPVVGILWVAQNGNKSIGDVTPLEATPLDASSLDILLYSPPPPDYVDKYVDQNFNVVAEVALGFIFVFDDVDNNGTYALEPNGLAFPDLFVAVAPVHAIVYVQSAPIADGYYLDYPGHYFADGLLSKDVTNWQDLTVGFHLGQHPCGTNKSTVTLVDPATTSVSLTTVPPTSSKPDDSQFGPCAAFW